MEPIKSSQLVRMWKERQVRHASALYTIYVIPKMYTIQKKVKGKQFIISISYLRGTGIGGRQNMIIFSVIMG